MECHAKCCQEWDDALISTHRTQKSLASISIFLYARNNCLDKFGEAYTSNVVCKSKRTIAEVIAPK